MADTLLYMNNMESAEAILNNTKTVAQEDSAYYFVLKAETDYRQGGIPDTNEINYSINYYKRHNDNRIHANAYYYKACAYIVTCDLLPKECFILLKEAEHLAEKTSDNSLKNKICAALSYANGIKNQPEEALKYAKKEYYFAQQMNTRRDMAYALLRMSTCYKKIGQNDSSEYFIMQCKTLANEIDDNDKAFFYNLLGECFINDNTDAALQYFHTALQYNTSPQSYNNIAKIYLAKNDTLNWRIYTDSALANSWYDSKIDILSGIAQKYYEHNDIANYKKTTDRMITTLEELNEYEKNNYSLEIQKKYDFERQQTEYEKNVWLFIAVISFLSTACLSLVFIYKYNTHKIKQLEKENAHLYDNQKLSNELNDEYKAQLDYFLEQNDEISSNRDKLTSVIEANNGMIAKLRTKIDELTQQSKEYYAIGKMIYDRICQNLSIADYKRNLANCLLYFETTYPDKAKIFAPYDGLSIENKIFLICDDGLKKTDEEISSIFDISQTTVRTRRSKMKLKLQ